MPRPVGRAFPRSRCLPAEGAVWLPNGATPSASAFDRHVHSIRSCDGPSIEVGWERATVQLFVMRLCYSRRMFAMAFPAQEQGAFVERSVRAVLRQLRSLADDD